MLKLNDYCVIYYFFMTLLLFGCGTKRQYSKKIPDAYCPIDTAIFSGDFSICEEEDSDKAIVRYKDTKQTILWIKNDGSHNNTNGLLFLGDTSLKNISSFFFDSIYLFSLNDNDINEGILYGIKFNSDGTMKILKNLNENNNYLLCRYGQFIIDTFQKKVLIANQSSTEDTNEEFSFSAYDFSGNSFKYITNVHGNTHYLFTKNQMLTLQSTWKSRFFGEHSEQLK